MKLPSWEVVPCEECDAPGTEVFVFMHHEWGFAPHITCACFDCGHEWSITEIELDEWRDKAKKETS